MMMNFKSIVAAMAMCACALPAGAATLASYSSVNGDSLVPTLAANVSGGTITRGAGAAPNVGGTFNSQDWTIGGDAAIARAAGDFVGTETDNFSFLGPVSLSALELAYDRSPTGPQSIAIDLFVDGITIENFFVDDAVAVNSSSTALVDLTRFDNVSAFGFWIVGYNATGTLGTGTFDFENRLDDDLAIVLTGDFIAAVPLPAGGALLLGGLGLLALRRRA